MTSFEEDRRWMKRALAVAQSGWGLARPNPTVGAVVVLDGVEVSCGYSQSISSGGAHAEVVAITRAAEACRGATLFVTMEPCSHRGKTLPCTDAVILAGFDRVVIGTRDANPLVSGRGVAQLEAASIAVSIEELDDQIPQLYSGFFHWIATGRPMVTLKMAQTANGMIAGLHGEPLQITGPETRLWTHNLRAECDAIVVSSRTVRNDNPRLDLRHASWLPARLPARVVLGRTIDFGSDRHLFAEDGAEVILCGERFSSTLPSTAEQIQNNGSDFSSAFSSLLELLGQRGMHHLLVEGGAEWSSALLESALCDRFLLLESPAVVVEGLSAEPGLSRALERCEVVRFARIGRDSLHVFRPV